MRAIQSTNMCLQQVPMCMSPAAKALGILLRTEGDMTIRKLTDFLNKESHMHK